MATLNVRNEAQKILFESELQGQISDGWWENLGVRDHWVPWGKATVQVDPANVGRDFFAQYDSYNFTNPNFLSAVGDRMLAEVQKSIPDYTRERMVVDLRDLKKIKKVRKS